ncbi:MAG: NAD(+)/NADH kinase [Phycisphaerae bacterium]|nr:NAD(+)/NADH kinase [Phycisphaerae bacterium]
MAESRIFILGNLTKPGVAEQIDSLQPWLREQAEILGVQSHIGDYPENISDARLCIVFGGDGTLLSAGRDLAAYHVPLLGVNMGKLGFLAEFSVDDLRHSLGHILAGEIQPVDRIMLKVTLWSSPKGQAREEIYTGLASNDVAIAAGDPFRMIDLHVHQGDHHLARYFGDGVVISTPTGSTGYNMSAGGPILQPSLEAVVITPVAPHTLSLRPMVLSPEPSLHVTANRVNEGTKMIIDGQIPHGLSDGQTVEIGRADVSLRIVPRPDHHYFQTLANKLHWGQSPHHQ